MPSSADTKVRGRFSEKRSGFLTSLRPKRISSSGKFRLFPPKDFFDSMGQKLKSSMRAYVFRFAPDIVAKVFFGRSTKILKTADALRVRRREGPHRFLPKRPPTFVLAQRVLRQQESLKIGFREIFGVVRFSTFATISALFGPGADQSRRSPTLSNLGAHARSPARVDFPTHPLNTWPNKRKKTVAKTTIQSRGGTPCRLHAGRC